MRLSGRCSGAGVGNNWGHPMKPTQLPGERFRTRDASCYHGCECWCHRLSKLDPKIRNFLMTLLNGGWLQDESVTE